MSCGTLLDKMVDHEIQASYQAIGGYDAIIWKVRVGYTTLAATLWSIVATEISWACIGVSDLVLIGIAAAITIVVSIIAASIDRNYVLRKFMVIYSMDIFRRSLLIHRIDYKVREEIKKLFLTISGESKNIESNMRDWADKDAELKQFAESIEANKVRAIREGLRIYVAIGSMAAVGLVLSISYDRFPAPIGKPASCEDRWHLDVADVEVVIEAVVERPG